MVKGLFVFMFALGSNGCFVNGAPFLNEVMVTDIISSVGHPRSDLVKLLMMNDSINIRGTGVVLQVPWDTTNPAGKGLMF
jgi:hypothetical protein